MIIKERNRETNGAAVRRILLPIAAAMMITSQSIPSFAEEQGEDRSASLDAELQDQVIQFDEIPELAANYSFPARLRDALLSDKTKDLKAIQDEAQSEIDELNDQIRELRGEQNDAADNRTKESYRQQIAILKQNRTALQAVRDGYRSSVHTAENAVSRSFHTTILTMTKGMEDLYFGYKQAEALDRLYGQQVELYTRMYSMKLTMQQNGSATALDVQNALSALNSARLSKTSAEEQLRSLRDTLGTSLGWKQEDTGTITLGDCPEYQEDFLDGRDLQADIETCARANASYSAAQRIKDQDPYTFDNREISIQKADGNLRTAMESFYNNCKEASAEKEAADAALLTAKRTAEQAERARKAGISGETAYQVQMVSYYAAELREEQSAIQAAKADNDYRWALKGIFG